MAVLVSAVFRSIQCGHLKHQVSKTDQIQANTFPGKEVHYHVTRLQHAIHHGPKRNVMTAMPKAGSLAPLRLRDQVKSSL